uniref:Uncharacterized protein n=1 Tax=Trichobilharzia regenti TaxID=157069 RepID=A0AA85KQA8_TRIRE|nr:unnamed protein product [Trichobilharzia regenti]CAH8852649.1 unnamed protein product [Trichobilharzia regenti]CAH8852651.1 unnamed protein product [Trichobilharzia regenti]
MQVRKINIDEPPVYISVTTSNTRKDDNNIEGVTTSIHDVSMEAVKHTSCQIVDRIPTDSSEMINTTDDKDMEIEGGHEGVVKLA